MEVSMRFTLFFAPCLIIALVLCLPLPSECCTGFYLKAKDGGVAYARSLEFAVDLESNVVVVPRGTKYEAEMPDGSKGIKWVSKYGIMGMNIFGKPLFVDAFNEKGLQVGMYFFPGFAGYAPYKKRNAKMSLAPVDFATWLLSNFATLDEVRNGIKDIRIVPTVLKELGISPPLHTFVVDPTGKSIVIEPIDGKLVVHDNPVSTITNSPPFDWHLTNLRQYIHLSTKQSNQLNLGALELDSIGSGSGMIGIPGDITPPSRFVRAAYFSNMLPQSPTVDKALDSAMRLMNYFYITKGMVLESGKPKQEYTQWVVFNDLKNKRLFFANYDNMNIRMVDMKKFEVKSGAVKYIEIKQPQIFKDVSGMVK